MHASPDADPAVARRPVLVVGEALVDVVRDAAGGTQEAPGGSPLNVAVGLGRLGHQVDLVTAVGDDERGRSVERHLAGSGVRLAEGARSLPRTSTAVARLQADGSAHYDFDLSWPVPPVPDPGGYDVVHSGSLGLALSPGREAVVDLLAASHGSRLVTVDPNVRPALMGPAPEAVARFEDLLRHVDVVKLSDEDAAWLLPDLLAAAAVERLAGRGPGLVVLTRGAQGSVLRTPAARVEVPAAPTRVVDTIGAGDAYMAGLVHGLVQRGCDRDPGSVAQLGEADLLELGRLAARVAALTVGRPGADPPRLEDLEAGRSG